VVVSTAAILVALAVNPMRTQGWFNDLQRPALDRAMGSGRANADPRTVVVGIDQRSIAAIGPWPWPRSKQGELIAKLSTLGAHTIAVDVVYGATSAQDAGFSSALAQAGNVIVGRITRPIVPARRGPMQSVASNEAKRAPVSVIANAAAMVGAVDVVVDPDGVVRAAPTAIDDGNELIPSLAVAALMHRDRLVGPPIARRRGVQVGDRFFPTDEHLALEISYSQALRDNGRAVVSALDVLRGEVSKDRLNDATVFVGMTDPSSTDRVRTPVVRRESTPGVFVHANAFDTMRTGSFLVPSSSKRSAALAGLAALLVGLALALTPVAVGLLITALTITGSLWWMLGNQLEAGIIHWTPGPILGVLTGALVGVAVRIWAEGRSKRQVLDLFGRYVPASVAAQLLAMNSVEDAVRGQRLDVTVFFCDQRGFTALSESLAPERVRAMCEQFYEFMSSRILRAGGTIMLFAGDEVFAVWGAPLASKDHASAALRCAQEVLRDAPLLQDRLRAYGLPDVDFGIGLNSGPVVAAHVGTDQRRQYSVLGDTVNLGARFCSKAVVGQVLFSDAVLDRIKASGDLGEFQYSTAGPYEFKGITRNIVAYQLGGSSTLDPMPSPELQVVIDLREDSVVKTGGARP
jgi:adenylate cyclase